MPVFRKKQVLVVVLFAMALVMFLALTVAAANPVPKYIYYENVDGALVRADFLQAEDDLFDNDSRLLEAIKNELARAITAGDQIFVECENGTFIDYRLAMQGGKTYSEAYEFLAEYEVPEQKASKELVIDSATGQPVERSILEVASLEELAAMEVAYGTVFPALNLPETVEATLNDDSTITLEVDWSEGEYDPETAGDYELAGALNLPEEISNPREIKASINVTVLPVMLTLFDQAGTYGPADEAEPETIEGDVIIMADGVTLQNYIITGDLIIAEEVGEGSVTLNNLDVKGELIVRGGGADSIIINGGEYSNIRIEYVDGKVRIVALGVTGPDGERVNVMIAEDVEGEVILEGDFDEVTIDAPGITVTFEGDSNVAQLTISENATGSIVNLSSGTAVDTVDVYASADIKGSGSVNTANIHSNDVEFEMIPEEVNVDDDVDDPVIPDPVPPSPPPAPTYVLTVDTMPAEDGAATGSGNYTAGQVVNIEATPGEVRYFFMWKAEPDVGTFADPYDADTTYTMPAQAVTITAYFSDSEDKPVLNATQGTGHDTIQAAIGAADPNDTILVKAGEYVEEGQIIINKNFTIIGEDKATTIIKPAQDTGSSGDARGWFLVPDYDTVFNLSNVTLDGEGKNIHQAIRSYGTGTIDNNIIKNMRYSDSVGFGIAVFGNSVISNNTIHDIQRVGISIFDMSLFLGGDPKADNVVVEGNTLIGRGPNADMLGYGIELDCGAKATITGNTFKHWGPDDTVWASAGILVHDNFSAGVAAEAVITGNTFQDNEYGLYVGYYGKDPSFVTATGNTFENNWRQVRIMEGADADVEAILSNNTFDSSVVVRDSSTNDIKSSSIYSYIQHGIDNADEGDTVDVGAGTYNIETQLQIDNPLTLRGPNANIPGYSEERGDEATIVGIVSDDLSVYGVRVGADDVVIEGLEFTGFKHSTIALAGSAGAGNLLIQNNLFRDLGAHAYYGYESVDIYDVMIKDNLVKNTSQEYVFASAFYFASASHKNAVISGNRMYDGFYSGIQGVFIDSVIEDNIIEGSTHQGIQLATNSNNVLVTGNQISNAAHDGTRGAIRLYNNAENITVKNNIVKDSYWGLEVRSGSSEDTNNIVYENSFVGNVMGINNQANFELDATNNWWGDASGPKHSSNPDGTGDEVSDNVLFSPWWADENGNTTGELPDE